MGGTLKAVMALSIMGVLLAYVLLQALIEVEYSSKIEAMKRDMEAYDIRSDEIYRESVRLETVIILLKAQLAGETEAAKVRVQEEGQTLLALKALSGNRTNIAARPTYVIAPTPPVNVTVDTSSIQNALRLNEIRQKTKTTATQRVTRAS